jgi:pSer/pThr/pTyr-binding forkhead associated (FHA) protein
MVVADSGIEIPLSAGQETVVGREDPVSGIFPDIDLTPHNGEEGGVSRRHCRIRRVGAGYTIEDLNSTNFTLLNQQRLEPGRPTALSDGDEVRVGRVRLIFKAGV